MATDPVSRYVEAVTEALDADLDDFIMRRHSHRPTNEHLATVAVATLTPLIAAEVRAEVAARIEAEASRSSYRDPSYATEAYLDAARIATEEAPS